MCGEAFGLIVEDARISGRFGRFVGCIVESYFQAIGLVSACSGEGFRLRDFSRGRLYLERDAFGYVCGGCGAVRRLGGAFGFSAGIDVSQYIGSVSLGAVVVGDNVLKGSYSSALALSVVEIRSAFFCFLVLARCAALFWGLIGRDYLAVIGVNSGYGVSRVFAFYFRGLGALPCCGGVFVYGVASLFCRGG